MASYDASAIIDTLPEEYRGSVTTSAGLKATVAGASIPIASVIELYGEGAGYTGSFYITATDSTRLGLTTQSRTVAVTLGGTTQTVRMIGSRPFGGGHTRWDFGAQL